MSTSLSGRGWNSLMYSTEVRTGKIFVFFMIFGQHFYWPKFWLLIKISKYLFSQIFFIFFPKKELFWQNFYSFPKILIFARNFDFCSRNFDFFGQFSFQYKLLDIFYIICIETSKKCLINLLILMFFRKLIFSKFFCQNFWFSSKNPIKLAPNFRSIRQAILNSVCLGWYLIPILSCHLRSTKMYHSLISQSYQSNHPQDVLYRL